MTSLGQEGHIVPCFAQPKGGKAKDAKRAEAKAKKEAKAGGAAYTLGAQKK